MEKERFDDVLGEGMPEYHGWWLRFIDSERCIHGVAYEDELQRSGIVKISSRGVFGKNQCGVEEWSYDDFGSIPENDPLFNFALENIKSEFGASKVQVNTDDADAIVVEL